MTKVNDYLILETKQAYDEGFRDGAACMEQEIKYQRDERRERVIAIVGYTIAAILMADGLVGIVNGIYQAIVH